MTLYTTWYNPEQCMDGAGCLQGSGDGMFASLVEVHPQWHMSMAACDPEMFGEIVSVSIGGVPESMLCGDNFGIHPNGDKVMTTFYDIELDTWFTRLDVYWSESLMGSLPDWGILYINDWRRLGGTRYTARQLQELGEIP